LRGCAEDALSLDPDNREAQTFLGAAQRNLSPEAAPPSPPSPRLAVEQVEIPASFASGRYTVKRFLGEGGKKKVYLAHDATLDRDVAFALIKTDGLDDTSRERIAREAQAMGRLGSHPHIVTVFDLGEEMGRPYMVTELMGGGDVEGVIEKAPEHKLPLPQALAIAEQVLQGLEFAHGKGIVHRDLKPGNVWLTADGVAKIGDFGLAVAIDRTRLTQAGMMVGTVSYMPPEQATGGEVTPRSDLYSLGAMLYEMVTGRPPFVGDEAVAIIGQHLNTPPVAPS
jgi:serine/threonine-protein kinase